MAIARMVLVYISSVPLNAPVSIEICRTLPSLYPAQIADPSDVAVIPVTPPAGWRSVRTSSPEAVFQSFTAPSPPVLATISADDERTIAVIACLCAFFSWITVPAFMA
jgi:hypothetical protein